MYSEYDPVVGCVFKERDLERELVPQEVYWAVPWCQHPLESDGRGIGKGGSWVVV